MSKTCYYELLEVTKTSNSSEIKTAYRKKAMQFHPDRNPDDTEAEEMFKKVSEAYEVLSDNNKRQIYDQYGHAGLEQGAGGFSGFHSTDDIFSSFGDIFEDIFGFSGGGQRRARRGADRQIEVEVEFLEACFGIEKEIEIDQKDDCTDCHATGAKNGTAIDTCDTCGGAGQVRMQQGFFSISSPCPKCGGRGQSIKEKCPTCKGSRYLEKNKKLKLKIPAGIDNGTRMVMRGQGMPGEGGRGDLYVYVHVKDHKDFVREDDHILSELNIDFASLALGLEKTIPTIHGSETLKIKAGTQSGDVITLRGKGVANVRSGRKGDHYIRIQAQTPKRLSKKETELLEQLQEFWAEEESSVSEAPKKKNKKGFFG